MNNDAPLALFITWTIYGTFLPGDARWWHKRNQGEQLPQPKLAQWHRDRLKHPILLLQERDRATVENAIEEISNFRGWKLWAKSARSNHVHLVVTAVARTPKLVRDQIKAKCTRELRVKNKSFLNRDVWTAGGDIEFLDADSEIDSCVKYVAEAQNRKNRGM